MILNNKTAVCYRFPIPDLRPVHDMERNPWWKRNVRKDVLFINLTEPSVRSESNNRTFLQSYKIYCSEILALFQVYLLYFFNCFPTPLSYSILFIDIDGTPILC